MTYSHSKFTGYYSTVQIIQVENQKFVHKTIRIPLSLAVVQELEQRIRLQRRALENMGVPIPELVGIEILQAEGSYNLLIKEKFEGLDFLDVVDEHNFEYYIEKLLHDIFKPLLKSTKNELTNVGIDPILRNYVYKSHEHKFCYVDFIPPKVLYKGHYSQEIPEIEGPFYDIRMFSHNNRAGLIYVQYVNFIRIFPQQRKTILGKFEQFLEEIDEPELKRYMIKSPFYRIENPIKAAEYVKKLTDWRGENYYYLREAICIAAELNLKFKSKQEDMFKLTTHERDASSKEYGLLPDTNFKKVKRELIKAFKEIE